MVLRNLLLCAMGVMIFACTPGYERPDTMIEKVTHQIQQTTYSLVRTGEWCGLGMPFSENAISDWSGVKGRYIIRKTVKDHTGDLLDWACMRHDMCYGMVGELFRSERSYGKTVSFEDKRRFRRVEWRLLKLCDAETYDELALYEHLSESTTYNLKHLMTNEGHILTMATVKDGIHNLYKDEANVTDCSDLRNNRIPVGMVSELRKLNDELFSNTPTGVFGPLEVGGNDELRKLRRQVRDGLKDGRKLTFAELEQVGYVSKYIANMIFNNNVFPSVRRPINPLFILYVLGLPGPEAKPQALWKAEDYSQYVLNKFGTSLVQKINERFTAVSMLKENVISCMERETPIFWFFGSNGDRGLRRYYGLKSDIKVD